MKSTRIFLLCLAILLSLCSVVAFLFFNTSLVRHMEQYVAIGLKERTRPNAVSFEIQINEQKKLLKTIADFLAIGDELGGEGHQEFLRSMVKNNNLLRCAISFPNGDSITHDGQTPNIAEEEFFIRAMNGELNITDPMPAIVDETKSVIIATCPITKDEKIIGTLSYTYLNDSIDSIFNLAYFNDTAHVFVVKQNGQIIMGNTLDFNGETNIVDYLHRDIESTHSGISGTEGSYLHASKDDKEKFYVNYYYLNINDWYLYSIVPEETAAETIMTVLKEQRILIAIVSVYVLIYILAEIFVWSLHRTNIDKLTGAPTFENFKRQAAKLIKKNPQQRYLIIKFDVKDFKLINRLYTFDEGNRLIKNIAIALKAIFPPNTTYCRLNADTFILLFPFSDEITVNAARSNFLYKFKSLMGDDFKTIVEFPTGQCLTTKEDAIKPDIIAILKKRILHTSMRSK